MSYLANKNLNANLLDGKHAGNNAGDIPVNNGTLNTNLNAHMIGGKYLHDICAFKGSVTGDFNNYTETGIYTVADTTGVANAPAGSSWGVLMVERSENYVSQKIMTVIGNRIWTRTRTETTWTSWVELIHSGNISSQSVSNADMVDGYHSTDIVPIGGIIMYAGGPPTDPAPTLNNFLYCDGSAISRTAFATLFNIIGTTFGAGDGYTTFNIPNFKAVVPRGMGQQAINGRIKDGSTLGALLEDRIQNITGGFRADNQATIATYGAMYSYGVYDNWPKQSGRSSLDGIAFDASRVARTGDYTRDNSLSVRFYIRYR